MRLGGLITLTMLAACGSASADGYEALVIEATPTKRAVAVSYAFMGCEEIENDKLKCQSCDVRQHDKDGNGIVTYATHWDMNFKRDENGEWARSVTGEHSDKSFKNPVSDFTNSEDGWARANDWCETVSGKDLKVLKDTRKEFFGDAQ